MTQRTMMAAILQTCGPATVHRVLTRNCVFLTKSTGTQFHQAACELSTLGLGTVVEVGKVLVFIKREPDDAAPILRAHPDLCRPDYYAERYKKPLSKMVTLRVRHGLSTMKLLPDKLLM